MATNRYQAVPDDAAVYAIGVAAELSELHPQTLRQYDKLGIVSPSRVGSARRLYSRIDILKLRYVADLTQAGVNLEGVKRILKLEAYIEYLHTQFGIPTTKANTNELELWKSKKQKRI
ncbi:MAG: MerR family transcriptional regulator [Candidatus Nanopelagicales bacterium]